LNASFDGLVFEAPAFIGWNLFGGVRFFFWIWSWILIGLDVGVGFLHVRCWGFNLTDWILMSWILIGLDLELEFNRLGCWSWI
jgi:hypothetical protein